MSKTIKQLADEIGVSKQAIHQKRKTEPLSTALQPFTETINGVVYISVDGEILIKQAFSTTNHKQVDNNKSENIDSDVYTILKTTIDTLQGQLNIKDKQLENKDKQIEELNSRLAESLELVDKAQNLHGADKAIEYYKKQYLLSDRAEELEKEKNRKPSFWSKLFKNKENEETEI